MRSLTIRSLVGLAVFGAATFGVANTEATTTAPAVRVMRLPEGGVAPQVLTGADGTVHLVYY